MRAVCDVVVTELPQLFLQLDLCHCTNLILKTVASIPVVAESIAFLRGINDDVLEEHFLLSLLKVVSASTHGRARSLMRPCSSRFGQNLFLSANVMSLRVAFERIVTHHSFQKKIEECAKK